MMNVMARQRRYSASDGALGARTNFFNAAAPTQGITSAKAITLAARKAKVLGALAPILNVISLFVGCLPNGGALGSYLYYSAICFSGVSCYRCGRIYFICFNECYYQKSRLGC